MTTDPKEFFKDNIKRIDPQKDPILHNMNYGLLTLCQQMDKIAANQQELAHRLYTLEKTFRSR